MNMPDYIENLVNQMNESLPGVVGAVIVFIVGWLLALLVRKVVKHIT